MTTFLDKKMEFDNGVEKSEFLKISLVPVDGEYISDIKIKNTDGDKLEEYYKWQFVYAIINSGMYNKDYIGVEVRFPKGNKTSAPLKVDCVIFDDKDWLERYRNYWKYKKDEDMDWLNEHILAVV